MALWSDELEAMRPQLREEADAFITSFSSELDDPNLPVAERLAFTPDMSAEDRRDPGISLLYADLHGLPPALFTVGADDHLVDDTLFLAARWELAGNPTELVVYPEGPHGCIGMPSVLERWFPRLTDFLRRAAAGSQ